MEQREPRGDSENSPQILPSTRSIKGRGKAARRLKKCGLRLKDYRENLISRVRKALAAATFEHKLSSRDADIRLLRKEVERLKGSLTVEREA